MGFKSCRGYTYKIEERGNNIIMSNLDLIAKKGEKNILKSMFADSDDSLGSGNDSSSDDDDGALLIGRGGEGGGESSTELGSSSHSSNSSSGTVEHLSRNGDIRVVLRQDAVRGIAHQLWPAASLLCNYFEDHFDRLVEQPYSELQLRSEGLEAPSSSEPSSEPSPNLSPPSSTSSSSSSNKKLNIIEVGAGIGLCGIFLKKRFPEYIGNMVLTDLPEAMETISNNIELNGLDHVSDSIQADVLSWGSEDDVNRISKVVLGGKRVDYIIAADCVYWECLFAPFAETLLSYANSGARIIIAHVRRWKKDGKFFDLCKKKGMTVEVLEEVVGVDINENTGQSLRSIKRIYQIYK